MKDTSKIDDIFERVYECVGEAFYKGYNQGWKDCQDMSIKINNENEKAMKLHKETGCPLFSCIEAIKTDDPIKYLQGKSKLQG